MKSIVFVSLFVVLIIVSIFETCVGADETDNETIDNLGPGGIKIYDIEMDCAMVGGLCVHTRDCALKTSRSGLCKLNQPFGVECCYELVERPATCKQNLGACMKFCNKNIQVPNTDCPESEVCCVLV